MYRVVGWSNTGLLLRTTIAFSFLPHLFSAHQNLLSCLYEVGSFGYTYISFWYPHVTSSYSRQLYAQGEYGSSTPTLAITQLKHPGFNYHLHCKIDVVFASASSKYTTRSLSSSRTLRSSSPSPSLPTPTSTTPKPSPSPSSNNPPQSQPVVPPQSQNDADQNRNIDFMQRARSFVSPRLFALRCLSFLSSFKHCSMFLLSKGISKKLLALVEEQDNEKREFCEKHDHVHFQVEAEAMRVLRNLIYSCSNRNLRLSRHAYYSRSSSSCKYFKLTDMEGWYPLWKRWSTVNCDPHLLLDLVKTLDCLICQEQTPLSDTDIEVYENEKVSSTPSPYVATGNHRLETPPESDFTQMVGVVLLGLVTNSQLRERDGKYAATTESRFETEIADEIKLYSARALATLAARDDASRYYLFKLGISGEIKRQWVRSVRYYSKMQQRHVVYLARLIAQFTALDRPSKHTLIDEGWLPILSEWAKSDNKQIRLATLEALSNLMSDEQIAHLVVRDYGFQMVEDVAKTLDVDLHIGVRRLLSQLINKPGEERETEMKLQKLNFPWVVDEDMHLCVRDVAIQR